MNGNFWSMPHYWTNTKTGISSQAKDKLSSKEQELSEEVGGAQDTNVDPILEWGHLMKVMIDIYSL